VEFQLLWKYISNSHNPREEYMQKFGFVLRVGVVLACLLALSLSLPGQERFGNVSGVATDATGAVLPDVAVTVVNRATNRTYNTRTGSDGTYQAQELEPGRYSVRFEKSGFARYEVADVLLLVGRTVKVDAQMQVGTVEVTVQVTETAPLIDPTSTLVANNITAEEFNSLPKPRTFQGMAVFSTSVNTGEIEGGYQINGASRREQLLY